ncbi:MAG: bifunctional pyr operon transcriptional regulator/uracil phosphoribosyltransferase PyrR [Clostridiales bacterium]|nr:bifunctional pyr operon transcriptional regulator/uracil phosphoribosyltransferase PyrR [Clostridiales bacterium]
MEIKTVLLDSIAIDRALRRISHEITEKNRGVSNVVLLGIARGGIPVCERLAENIKKIENVSVPVGKLDITMYRDDLKSIGKEAKVNGSEIDFSLEGKDVVLCDDVLFTGRTVRAGIEAVFKLGRPKTIQLAVLIDRGHRELPVRADYVGKNVPTSHDEVVSVKFDVDEGNRAVILSLKNN